ncbi:MAG: CPBP family intramembrane glutamate endopeptidase [Novosphingobium sp.]
MTEPTAPLTVRAVLREFLDFLRRPAILTPQGWRGGGGKRWAVLTALLVIGLIGVMMPFLELWQKAFDLPSPDAFAKMDKRWLVPVVVLIAPPIEELLFRGWQRGSVSALWLLGCALAAVAVLTFVTDPAQALLAGGALLALLVAAPLGWFLLRKRPAPLAWFARVYPWIFYLVAAGFALVHLSNYPSVSLLAVPLVLPQLWAALVLGYLRQRLGLVQGILAHMTANACSIGLALLGGL